MTWLTIRRILGRLTRLLSLVLVAALGTMYFMRFAPGYFTDTREMDGQYANQARAELKTQEDRQGTILALTKGVMSNWRHGDLGRSKQYDVPVTELIRSRFGLTARLLLSGVCCGWLVALGLALPLSSRQGWSGEWAITLVTCILLAIPIGAMATACLLLDHGGALGVLTVVVAVRDFKFVYKLLCEAKFASPLMYARSQGILGRRVICIYMLPRISRELLAIAMVSFVTALSAIVPVEVIFDEAGIGQLAWAGAMNRDLPIVLSVALVMASMVGLASTIAEPRELKATL